MGSARFPGVRKAMMSHSSKAGALPRPDHVGELGESEEKRCPEDDGEQRDRLDAGDASDQPVPGGAIKQVSPGRHEASFAIAGLIWNKDPPPDNRPALEELMDRGV